MIRYALACDMGHTFESWFRDSVAYDNQVAGGFLACPTCRSVRVAKTIMAPAVVGRGLVPRPVTVDPVVPTEDGPQVGASLDVALLDEKSRERREMIRAFREKLVTDGHDVGSGFATEARRMHEGETPVRQIYGQASPDEARDLLEDGIMVLPMPVVPDELN